MQQLLDTANDVQEIAAASVIDINRAGGEATATTVELGSDVLRRVTPVGPVVPFGPGIESYLTRTVDTGFDLAAGLLDLQRALATRLLDAVRPLLLGEPLPESPRRGKSGAKADKADKAA